MRTFIILHTKEHSKFKDFIKKKPGSISISYIDVLNQQEKYLLLGENKNNSILELELFNKIYDSISNLHNIKYHSILYFMDTLDYIILKNFIGTIEKYSKKNKIPLEILVCDLDETTPNIELCIEKLLETENIRRVNKEFIQQIF